ncbi:hypothetical protein [uncultured Cyclobacterium sp.]|uniref:hypothetical protein n=1 Tax=uncultured Cyclobacterium sp. TaxID=453820 RepID=UPI0030EF3390|tara:strand:+ start:5340 stop:5534 length:195 start_codon:yes stop_codon:yes gene_type:complete
MPWDDLEVILNKRIPPKQRGGHAHHPRVLIGAVIISLLSFSADPNYYSQNHAQGPNWSSHHVGN